MLIMKLPPEIMSIIFGFVYAQSPNVQLHYWEYWPWQPDPVVKIPTLKQHAILNLMLVCNTWTAGVFLDALGLQLYRKKQVMPLACHNPDGVDKYDAEEELHGLFTGHTLPRLVSLNIWGTVRSPTGGSPRYANLRKLEMDAPALTTLSLPWFTNPSEIPLPPTVTTVKSSSMPMSHPSNGFHGIPNPGVLRSLCVTVHNTTDCFHDIDIPGLSHLRVAFTHLLHYALHSLRSVYRLSNLESLSIITPDHSVDISLPSLPKVRFLEWIEGPIGAASSFEAILGACPNLLHLTCIPLRIMYDNNTSIPLSVVTEEVARPFALLEWQDRQTGEFVYCRQLRTLCVEGYQVELGPLLGKRPMLRLCAWDRYAWMGQSE
ncbi:hypothetical protein FRB99_001205 [Tulasnella sp. 403]|nr:hypothetical protein FRB99_001205 [Tulasnella sp. 403]